MCAFIWACPTGEEFCEVSKKVLCWCGWSLILCLCPVKDPLKGLKVDDSQGNSEGHRAFWMLFIFPASCWMEKLLAKEENLLPS